MPRDLPDFLESYLEYSQNTESPLSYHTWAGISVVSAALERRVYMRWGHSEIFPNQYIVLVGPSGVRKGEPLIIAKGFLEEAGIKLIAEAITKEALILRMKGAFTNYDDGGKIKFQCPVTCIAEEMSVFLGEGNTQFLADLTAWYDSRQKWTYETKWSGTDEVVGVCVNILGSTAPDWIPLTIPQGAIGGGFTSRIIFVVEHRKARNISNPNLTTIDSDLRQALTHDLEQISALTGEAVFSQEALAIYEEWYLREEKRTASGRPVISDPRFGGYVSRRATHVKKVGMAVSAARSDSLVVEAPDIKRAIGLLEQVETNMPDVFGKVGRSMYAEQTHEILEYIQKRGETTRSEVMQMFYRDVDGRTIEIIEATMTATRLVQVKLNKEDGSIRYKWLG